MTIKRKLLAIISLMAITTVLLMVGVWALKTIDFSIGGSISFSATGINATISKGVLANGSLEDAANKMKAVVLNTDKTQAQIEQEFLSWQNLELLFNEEADDVTITFTITNDSKVENEYLNIAVTINQGTQVNATASINVASKIINPGESQQFVITFAVTDKTANASLSGFEINFNMQLTNKIPITLKHDTVNKYYYVEMGTYNSQPVKWKVVGVKNTETNKVERYIYNENIAPTGELTFILETLTTSHEFGYYFYNEVWDDSGYEIVDYTEEGNNDYATSAIRQYITGHDCAEKENGQDYIVSGNYLEDINIDITTDSIYTKIKERNIQDLYKNINWDDNNATIFDGTTDVTGSDKLWIPSVAEIYAILCGGDISTMPNSWSKYNEELTWYSESYWLRSPVFTDRYYTQIVQFSTYGCYISGDEVDMEKFVRPMFLLEV